MSFDSGLFALLPILIMDCDPNCVGTRTRHLVLQVRRNQEVITRAKLQPTVHKLKGRAAANEGYPLGPFLIVPRTRRAGGPEGNYVFEAKLNPSKERGDDFAAFMAWITEKRTNLW
jgi:hypothetical protein